MNEKCYYPINEESAKTAKQSNSFNDYLVNSVTKECQSMVDEAVEIAEKQKECLDPSYHEKIDNTLHTYCLKLAENINSCNYISASVPSIMLAGGGNFSVHKKEKQMFFRLQNTTNFCRISMSLKNICKKFYY